MRQDARARNTAACCGVKTRLRLNVSPKARMMSAISSDEVRTGAATTAAHATTDAGYRGRGPLIGTSLSSGLLVAATMAPLTRV